MKVYNLFARKVVQFDSYSDFEAQRTTVAKELFQNTLKENFVEKLNSKLLTYNGDGTTVDYILPGGNIGFKIELGDTEYTGYTSTSSESYIIQYVGFYLYDVATGNTLRSVTYKHRIDFLKVEANSTEQEYVFEYSQDKIYTVENDDSFVLWFPTGLTVGLDGINGAVTEGGGFLAIDKTFNSDGYTVAFSDKKYTSVGLYRLSDKKRYYCFDRKINVRLDIGITFKEKTNILDGSLNIVDVFQNIYNIYKKSTYTQNEYNICGPGHELYIDGKMFRQITGNYYIHDKET